MPPERELVAQWLDHARRDLELARWVMTQRSDFAAQVCFHCQQAAEKALKAYLVYHGREFIWSHDLAYLLTCCQSVDVSAANLRSSAEPLSKYAVRFRYPGSGPEPEGDEAAASLERARAVLDWVERTIDSQRV
jgi:HEPN domain-containing protein